MNVVKNPQFGDFLLKNGKYIRCPKSLIDLILNLKKRGENLKQKDGFSKKIGAFLIKRSEALRKSRLNDVAGIYLADGISYLSSTEAKKTWRKAKHYCNSYSRSAYSAESPRVGTLGFIFHNMKEINRYAEAAGLPQIPLCCFWSRDRVMRESNTTTNLKVAIDFADSKAKMRIADCPLNDDCHTCSVICVTKVR